MLNSRGITRAKDPAMQLVLVEKPSEIKRPVVMPRPGEMVLVKPKTVDSENDLPSIDKPRDFYEPNGTFINQSEPSPELDAEKKILGIERKWWIIAAVSAVVIIGIVVFIAKKK